MKQLKLYTQLTSEKKKILNEIYRKEFGKDFTTSYKNNVLREKIQKNIFAKLEIEITRFEKNGKNIVLGLDWRKVFFYKDIRAIKSILDSAFFNHQFQIECLQSFIKN